MSNDVDSNIKISEYLKKNPTHRFKSYTITVVFILLVIGLIFLTGKVGPDLFGLILFIVIVSLPLVILFRYKLASILPKTLSDNLMEIDHDDSKERKLKIKVSIPLLIKQIMIYVVIVLLLIGSCILLYKSYNELVVKTSIIYILGAFISQALGGIILLDINNIIQSGTTIIDK